MDLQLVIDFSTKMMFQMILIGQSNRDIPN